MFILCVCFVFVFRHFKIPTHTASQTLLGKPVAAMIVLQNKSQKLKEYQEYQEYQDPPNKKKWIMKMEFVEFVESQPQIMEYSHNPNSTQPKVGFDMNITAVTVPILAKHNR